MNDTKLSAPRPTAPIRVWDWTVRLGHWLMAAAFLTAYATSESEALRMIHITSGLTAMAIAAYRIAWGLVGSRHARFSAFMRPPRQALDYLRSLMSAHPMHSTGHNPAGAWAVVGLLGLTLLSGATGWANENDLGGRLVEEAHEVLANLAIALVGLHLAAVAISSWLHRENLVRPMLTGSKLGYPDEEIPRHAGWLGALLLITWVFGMVFWLR